MTRMMGSLLGLVSLLQLLGLLDRASALVERGGLAAILRFVALQSPGLIAQSISLSVLIGATLTFLRIAGTLEMVAMQACGRSLGQTLRALLPAALLIAAVQFALQNEVVPRTERAFADWWFRTTPSSVAAAPPARLWFRALGGVKPDVAAADAVSPDGARLDGLMILQRSATGDLAARLDAEYAIRHDGRWTLHGVRIARANAQRLERLAQLDWPHGPVPANMIELARPIDAIAFERLWAVLRGHWSGARGPLFYQTLLNRALSSLLDPIVMLLLALPTALAPARFGAGLAGLSGLALGLGYLVCAGLLSALGNAGWLPPLVAGWGATLAFCVVGVSRIARAEGG